jgi:hypothetical protein
MAVPTPGMMFFALVYLAVFKRSKILLQPFIFLVHHLYATGRALLGFCFRLTPKPARFPQKWSLTFLVSDQISKHSWQDNRTKIRSELTFTLTHTMPLLNTRTSRAG